MTVIEHPRSAPFEPPRTGSAPSETSRFAPHTQRAALAAALLTLASLTVMLWPLGSVIRSREWVIAVLGVALAGVATALLMRAFTRRWPRGIRVGVTVAAQVAVMTAVIMRQNFADEAWAGIIPTTALTRQVPELVTTAVQQIVHGSAPLTMTLPLSVTLALGVLLLTVILDVLLAVAGLPLVVGMLVATLSAVPALALGRGVDKPLFVAWAVLFLVLLRVPTVVATHSRTRTVVAPRPRTTAAFLVGALAIATTLAFVPSVPTKPSGIGGGDGLHINPSLDLGADLRRDDSSVAMTLITTADRAPYLRVASLSSFDGNVWNPDEAPAQPLGERTELGGRNTDIEQIADTTSIRVTGLTGSWLPVPFAARAVRGLDGTWQTHPANGTIRATSGDIKGQNYTVESTSLDPTLEQARAARASPAYVSAEFSALPDNLPPVIAETAARVVANESTDFDRLVTLQDWFRSEFRYSLEAPVADDFDGTGADAVAAFLEEQAGYCIHFAGSFALMARTLGMPSRIIVGYLPGTPTSQKQEDQTVYLVATDQLHAWPEVYFDDLGWVAFEPTTTLGAPTRFVSEQQASSGNSAAPGPNPTTSQSAPDLTETPSDAPDADRDTGTNTTTTASIPWPVLALLATLVLLAASPALARLWIRQRRMLRARRGDAAAAWAELRDTMIDYALDAPDSETPRERGARLREASGASSASDAASADSAIRSLVTAIERASYASASAAPTDFAADVHAIRIALRDAATTPRTRLRAVVLPRSLAQAFTNARAPRRANPR